MRVALLDVNILAALSWPAHEHHAAAHAWLRNRGRAPWATCPLTELGFLRLLMNPAFSREALSLKNALALLAQAVADDRHEFWGMRQPVARAIHGLESRFQGYRQLTDGYLLSLAKQQKGVLATFDSGVQSLGLTDFSSWLEIVPTA